MRKSIFLISIFSIFIDYTKAGLDTFSYLDKVEDWTIERKIDTSLETVSCRASIDKYGTWFATRIRLDRNDNLIIPIEYMEKDLPHDSTLEVVKLVLKRCREGVIYLSE